MAECVCRVTSKKKGSQTTEGHNEDEGERKSPLWAGRRRLISGGAARCRRRWGGMDDILGEQCCEGIARQRPQRERGGWERAR